MSTFLSKSPISHVTMCYQFSHIKLKKKMLILPRQKRVVHEELGALNTQNTNRWIFPHHLSCFKLFPHQKVKNIAWTFQFWVAAQLSSTLRDEWSPGFDSPELVHQQALWVPAVNGMKTVAISGSVCKKGRRVEPLVNVFQFRPHDWGSRVRWGETGSCQDVSIKTRPTIPAGIARHCICAERWSFVCAVAHTFFRPSDTNEHTRFSKEIVWQKRKHPKAPK